MLTFPAKAGLIDALTKINALSGTVSEIGGVLERLRLEIEAMLGKLRYMPAYDFGVDTPSQQELTDYALAHTGLDAVANSTSIVNLFNGHEWIYNEEGDEWVDLQFSAIGQATNTSLGVVKGSTDTGKVSVDGVTGEMTVNLTSLPANGGNADTAKKLYTARTINGVSFDGTENIFALMNNIKSANNVDFNTLKNGRWSVLIDTAIDVNQPEITTGWWYVVVWDNRSSSNELIQIATKDFVRFWRRSLNQNTLIWSNWERLNDNLSIRSHLDWNKSSPYYIFATADENYTEVILRSNANGSGITNVSNITVNKAINVPTSGAGNIWITADNKLHIRSGSTERVI